MDLYPKFAYGSQFSGEKKYLKIQYLVAKILSKLGGSFFGKVFENPPFMEWFLTNLIFEQPSPPLHTPKPWSERINCIHLELSLGRYLHVIRNKLEYEDNLKHEDNLK